MTAATCPSGTIKKREVKTPLVALMAAWLLSGCTSFGDVTWRMEESCGPLPAELTTYRLSSHNMPGFIDAAVLFSAHQALQKRGLLPDEEDPDIDVSLTFEYVSLDPEPREKDDFDEKLMSSNTTRFNALTHIAVVDRQKRTVLSATMNRAHNIMGNETFHTERAILMIHSAFEAVFANLDRPCNSESS